MMIHTMTVAPAPFEKILRGTKIIESRLYDEKRQRIVPGDRIVFSCKTDPSRKVTTIVQALYRYPAFDNLFADFPPSFFGGATRESLMKEIATFYTKEERKNYGVIGIKIEVLP